MSDTDDGPRKTSQLGNITFADAVLLKFVDLTQGEKKNRDRKGRLDDFRAWLLSSVIGSTTATLNNQILVPLFDPSKSGALRNTNADIDDFSVYVSHSLGLGSSATKNTGVTSGTVPLNGGDAAFAALSATGDITRSSNNTGGDNYITSLNGGVGSNAGTNAGFAAILGALANGYAIFNTRGGSAPQGQISTGAGLTGGLAIGTGAGGINIAPFNGIVAVNGSVTARTGFYAQGATGGFAFLSPGGAGNSGYAAWFKPDGVTRIGYMGYDPNDLLVNLDNPASKFRVVNGDATFSNNLGIRTNAPSVPLHVVGNARFEQTTYGIVDWVLSGAGANEKIWNLVTNNGDKSWGIQAVDDVYSSGYFALKFTRSGTNISKVYIAGDVGFGTNSPAARAHVVGGNVRVENYDYPGVTLLASGGGADEKVWEWFVDRTQKTFGVRALNDAYTTANTGFSIYRSGTGIIGVGLGATTAPSIDNLFSMGTSALRWSVFYGATGTINTSDARTKTAVRSLNERELAAARDLRAEIGAFQFLDAVASKGADKARLHIGMTVQRALEIMDRHGLNAWDYAPFCRDEITKKETRTRIETREKKIDVEKDSFEIEVIDGKPVQVKKTRIVQEQVVNMLPVLDEAGEPVTESRIRRDENGEPIIERKQAMDSTGKPVTQIVQALGDDGHQIIDWEPVLDDAGKPIIEMRGVFAESGEATFEPFPLRRPVPRNKTAFVMEDVPVYETVAVLHPVPVMEEFEVEYEVDVPDGDRLGFRTDQLIMFMLRGL